MASEDSAHIAQSFLLIVRTRRIVTAIDGSSAGYTEFPAYSQILLRQRFHLRTVHLVTTPAVTGAAGLATSSHGRP